MHASHDTEFDQKELCIFNHKGWMIGYMDDDHTSADYCVMRALEKEPKGIILGDCSMDDFAFYEKYYDKYRTEPVIEYGNAENLIGRQAFLNYFKTKFPIDLHFYRDKADFLIYPQLIFHLIHE